MRVSAAAFVRPLAGELVAGDACIVEPWARGLVVAVADGLGHGPAAAVAAAAFVEHVCAAREAPLAAVIEGAHRALRETRGAVAVLARFDELLRTVELAGVGDVTALLASGGADPRPVPLSAGVLGSAFRTVRPQVFAFGVGDLLVLHSDGVHRRFDLAPFRALAPRAFAEAVVSEHGKAWDDAACVVATGEEIDAKASSVVDSATRPVARPAGSWFPPDAKVRAQGG